MPPKTLSWITPALLAICIGMCCCLHKGGLTTDHPFHENMSNISVVDRGITREDDTIVRNDNALKAVGRDPNQRKENYFPNENVSKDSARVRDVTEKYDIVLEKDSTFVNTDKGTDGGTSLSYIETSFNGGGSITVSSIIRGLGIAHKNMDQNRPQSLQYDVRGYRNKIDELHETQEQSSLPYIWDKSRQTARDILLGYCEHSCGEVSPKSSFSIQNNKNESSEQENTDKCDNLICFPCVCKAKKYQPEAGTTPVAEEETGNKFCAMGICCPERQEDHSEVANDGHNTGCLAQPYEKTYVLIRCPDDFNTNQSLRDACEHARGELTIDEPVMDLNTSIVYRNKQCAQCHGVLAYTPWHLAVACHSFQQLYHVMSEHELAFQSKLVKQFDNSAICGLFHEPVSPTDIPQVERCPEEFFKQRITTATEATSRRGNTSHDGFVISVCNVTRLWTHFDADIQSGCETFTDLAFRVRENEYDQPHQTVWATPERWTGRVFQNLFCAMCNGFQPERKECISISHGLPEEKTHPLTFLSGLKDNRQAPISAQHECPNGQWIAFDNVCRNLSCPPGKYLIFEEKRTCNTSVTIIRGLHYKIHLILAPQTDFVLAFHKHRVLNDLIKNPLTKTFQNKTKGLVASVYTTFNIVYLPVSRAKSTGIFVNELHIKNIEILANIEASFQAERDEVEETLLEKILLREWILNIISIDKTVVFTPFTVGRGGFYDPNNSFNRSETTLVEFPKNGKKVEDDVVPYVFDINKIIWINRLMVCPTVEFDPSEFQIKIGGKPVVRSEFEFTVYFLSTFGKEDSYSVVLMRKELMLEAPEFSWTIREDGSFVICVDTLEELLARYKSRDSSLFWQYALSMSAIPLSIFCLVLVVIVYALLPELRTQPGLNTMGMCATLLVAQVALLLSSHRVVSGVWCAALGVIVHLLWLSTFCWTTVCSVHMCRSFSCGTTSGLRCGPGSLRVLACNELLTLLVPGVVVAIVMGLSWHKLGGHTIGYSSSTCYLLSTFTVGLAVVLPLSLTVAVNLILYLLTVYRIHSIIKLRTRSTEGNGRVSTTNNGNIGGRQHVRACLRLSLLTGTTWLLSILAEGVDLDWLRVLSILANGGQGALLFLSYVTTKRVAVMLAGRMGLRREVTTTISSVSGNCI